MRLTRLLRVAAAAVLLAPATLTEARETYHTRSASAEPPEAKRVLAAASPLHAALGATLASGVPESVSLSAVTTPALLGGGNAYKITVPAGARRLEVQLVTATAGADLDLHIRYGAPPQLSGDRVIDDFHATSYSGYEAYTVSTFTDPPIQAGDYYIALAVHTTGVPISATLTATHGSDDFRGITLTSGTPSSFRLPGVDEPTFFVGINTFRIAVPAGASRLEVSAQAVVPNADADVDLFLRRGQPPELGATSVETDFSSTRFGGSESITVDTATDPPIAEGVYYARFGLHTTGKTVEGLITASVTGGGGGGPACTYALDPASATVPAAGGPGTVSISAPAGCQWSAASDSSWLTVTSATSGSGPGSVSYSAAPNTGSSGRTGSLTIAGQNFAVTQAAQSGGGGGPPPAINQGGVVNAADYTPNFAPGILFSIYGANLAAGTVVAEAVPLPRELGGVSVEIVDGQRVSTAPLVFVSAGQINAQLPFGLTSATVGVRVHTAAGVSNTESVPLSSRAPRLLTKTLDGRGEAIVLHADWSWVEAASPATAGEIVIMFLTGLGAVSPPIAEGEPGGDGGAGGPLNRVSDSVSVLVNGSPAIVHFAGLAPGFPGLYQINFEVPGVVPSGNASVVVRVGGRDSQASVGMLCSASAWLLAGGGTVGPAGGAVTGQGISLNIPAGGFTQSETVSLYRVREDKPAFATQAGDLFGLSGLPAAIPKPVTVEIDVNGHSLDPNRTYVIAREPGEFGGEFRVKATVDGSLVKATLPPRIGPPPLAGTNALPEGPLAPRRAGGVDLDLLLRVATRLSETKRGIVDVTFEDHVSAAEAAEVAATLYTEIGESGGLFPDRLRPVYVYIGDYEGALAEPWGEHLISSWTGAASIKLDTDCWRWMPANSNALAIKAAHLFVHLYQEALDRQANNGRPLRRPDWQWANEAVAAAYEKIVSKPGDYFSPHSILNFGRLAGGLERNASPLEHGAAAGLFVNYLNRADRLAFHPIINASARPDTPSPVGYLREVHNNLGEKWRLFCHQLGQAKWYTGATGSDSVITGELAKLADQEYFAFAQAQSLTKTYPMQNLSVRFHTVGIDFDPPADAKLTAEAIGNPNLRVALYDHSLAPLTGEPAPAVELDDLRKGERLLLVVSNAQVGPPYDANTPVTVEVKVAGTSLISKLQPTVYLESRVVGKYLCAPESAEPCPYEDWHWIKTKDAGGQPVTWSGRNFSQSTVKNFSTGASTSITIEGTVSADGATLERATVKYRHEGPAAGTVRILEYGIRDLPLKRQSFFNPNWRYGYYLQGADASQHLSNFKLERSYEGKLLYRTTGIDLSYIEFNIHSRTPAY